MLQWLAPSPYRKKVLSSDLLAVTVGFRCRICMFFACLCGFPPGILVSSNMQIRLTCYSKLPRGVNVVVLLCVSPEIDSRPAQGETPPLAQSQLGLSPPGPSLEVRLYWGTVPVFFWLRNVPVFQNSKPTTHSACIQVWILHLTI